MRTVRDLVAALAATGSAHPALTWYSTGAERVELSGRVLANWAVKATGLLVSEADAEAGVRVSLDLPPHWRSVVWALGAWVAGAQVVLGPDPAADVVVTDRPDEAGGAPGAVVIAVALPALALRYPAALPPGVLDGAADLMTYPDALGWVPPLDLDAPALDGGPAHGEVLEWARGAVVGGVEPGARLLVTTDVGSRTVLEAGLATWSADGSLVLVDAQESEREAIGRAERVTGRLTR